MNGHIDSALPFPSDPSRPSDPRHGAPSRASGVPCAGPGPVQSGSRGGSLPASGAWDLGTRGVSLPPSGEQHPKTKGAPLPVPGPQGSRTSADPLSASGPQSPGTGGVPLPAADLQDSGPASAAPADEDDGAQPQVVLRGPAELAEALPYLLGFHPDDSIVMIGVHGADGRFGARLRLAIPADPALWSSLAARAADDLVNGAGPARRPDAVALFLCQDPAPGETPGALRERLGPLAQHLRRACGALDVPVVEAVCVCGGRWWSYVCVGTDCCPPEGTPLGREGTSVMAAAAAYAGIRVRGTLRELQARLRPRELDELPSQQRAFDDASADLIPRMLLNGDVDTVRAETLALASAALDRFRAAPAPDDPSGDQRDDALLGDDEVASIILGLQDRDTRDRAAEWMEGEDAPAALRLWRALSRRCAGPYSGHAAAPLTLAGWVAWANGDDPTARVALGLALEADPDYTFARLLHQACSHGLDPEPLRECLREERRTRTARVVRRSRFSRPGAGAAPRRRTDCTTRPPAGTGPGVRPRTRRGDRMGGEETPC